LDRKDIRFERVSFLTANDFGANIPSFARPIRSHDSSPSAGHETFRQSASEFAVARAGRLALYIELIRRLPICQRSRGVNARKLGVAKSNRDEQRALRAKVVRR
jgi:hypothetical protein